jgi:hypothetical protein
MTPALIARFFAKVAAPDCRGCHIWTGAKNDKGYGRFGVNGKNRFAHRVAWEIAFGPIPDRQLVLHRCDNPNCVNPGHFFLGTQADNNADMDRKGRRRFLVGERATKAKLTPDQVFYVRRSPLTNTELARELGVSRKAVAFIREGVNWRHL